MRTPGLPLLVLFPVLVLGLGCAHAGPRPPPAPPPAACAAATVAVLREATPGVDPVETWRAILASEALRQRLAPGAAGPVRLAARRQGRGAVLQLAARAPTPPAALAACSAALDAAFAFGGEALEFLEAQQRALRAELDERRRALQALRRDHDLLALPAAARLADARARVGELTRDLADPRRAGEPPRAALESARGEALRLAALEEEERSLSREAEGAERRLALVEARLGEATLARIVDQDLRVLAPCAPCAPEPLTPR